jgi:hypothetical protein
MPVVEVASRGHAREHAGLKLPLRCFSKLLMLMNKNPITTASSWRSASRASRQARSERLCLPSGAVVLAVKPDPLEWILSGRIPQRLLSVALESDLGTTAATPKEVCEEEILDLARFATQLVRASVVQPSIGDGPEEIPMDDIPIEDRTFIFEWACRSLRQAGNDTAGTTTRQRTTLAEKDLTQEDLSSAKLERFREK